MNGSEMEKIEKLRKQIDNIDDRLAKLLDERASVAAEIGKLKIRENRSIYDRRREAEILRRVALGAKILSAEDMQLIYRSILDTVRKYLERLEITRG